MRSTCSKKYREISYRIWIW